MLKNEAFLHCFYAKLLYFSLLYIIKVKNITILSKNNAKMHQFFLIFKYIC